MKKNLMIFVGLLIWGLTLGFSSNAIAASNDAIIEKCFALGKEKVKMHAELLGCEIVTEIEPSGIDNRWYNPSAYVWYAADVKCPATTFEIEKMVQYYAGNCL